MSALQRKSPVSKWFMLTGSVALIGMAAYVSKAVADTPDSTSSSSSTTMSTDTNANTTGATGTSSTNATSTTTDVNGNTTTNSSSTGTGTNNNNNTGNYNNYGAGTGSSMDTGMNNDTTRRHHRRNRNRGDMSGDNGMSNTGYTGYRTSFMDYAPSIPAGAFIDQSVGPVTWIGREQERVLGYRGEMTTTTTPGSTTTTTTTTYQPTPAMDNTAMTVTDADAASIRSALNHGSKEIALSVVASRRAGSEYVKQFADKMIRDHSIANQQLKDLASRHGIDTTNTGWVVPTESIMFGDAQRPASGADFDHWYMRQMILDHQMAVDMLQQAAGQPGGFGRWAARTLPTVREHLQIAEDLAGSDGNGPIPQ